jgi:hypothetical protein
MPVPTPIWLWPLLPLFSQRDYNPRREQEFNERLNNLILLMFGSFIVWVILACLCACWAEYKERKRPPRVNTDQNGRAWVKINDDWVLASSVVTKVASTDKPFCEEHREERQ